MAFIRRNKLLLATMSIIFSIIVSTATFIQWADNRYATIKEMSLVLRYLDRIEKRLDTLKGL